MDKIMNPKVIIPGPSEPRRWALPAMVVLGLVAASCQILNLFQGPTGPSFPHDIHEEEGLDCSMCHEGAEDRPDAGFPESANGCMLCHEELDAAKPFDRTVAAFLVDEQPRWLSRSDLYAGEMTFNHGAHYDAEIDCEACHGPQTGGEGQGLRIRGGKATCLQCHADTPRGNDCSVCHKTLRLDIPPPSHEANWKRFHGVNSRQLIAGMGETTCAQCHQEDTCIRCHQVEQPSSHTNFWRTRGHGLSAGIDRSSCLACHQPDYCDRCHRSTQPRSHRGAFGPPGNRHCASCHLPAQGLSCGVCHSNFPAHSPGPGTPGNVQHMTANSPFDCLLCHVGLSHPNPGGDCRQCHL